jgi:hypothetical protein
MQNNNDNYDGNNNNNNNKLIPLIIGQREHSQSLRKQPDSIPEKHEIKERQNSHTRHCAHTSGSTNVKIQNVYRAKLHYRYLVL